MRFSTILTAILLVLTAATAAAVPADSVGTAVPGDTLSRPTRHRRQAVTAAPERNVTRLVNIEGDTVLLDMSADSVAALDGLVLKADSVAPAAPQPRVFNPDPKRAMWLSVLCPGLGQIYNRRYWKLPIIVGGFVGLAYGTSWNNRMLQDYRRGYRDIMDNDPNTRSYMNFFAPTVREEDLSPEWIKNTMRNQRDYYRRYRDICIIGMVALYLLNVVDAYVDASLAHFDISPDLSLDLRPSTIDSDSHVVAAGGRLPSVGLQCAVTF